MKIIILITLSLSFSAEASLRDFNDGLKKAFYFDKIERANLTSDKIRVTKFGRLGRILSPDATATYNDKTNTISLDESLLSKKGKRYSVKNAQNILTPNYSGFTPVTTIFHELAHAEIDIFIENEKELTDLALMQFYKSKLRPLYRKYFKGINPWTVFHEHFAYYRTDLLETMALDIMDIMMENGWVASSGRCYLTPHLKKLLESGVSLEEFSEITSQKKRNYRDVTPNFIFVRGKDLNPRSIAENDKRTMREAHLLFWSYHQEFYRGPRSAKEIALRMNQDINYDDLRNCREHLYYK
ncbi:MAG: hypothetical protein WDA09_09545 [Bacteriovoracaceae bacterium]